jgi:hypothetical protein
MDCEQTRRAVVIDPTHLRAEAQSHADTCAACAAFFTGHLQHSALLRRSMVQTHAPQLQARLLAAQQMSEQAQASSQQQGITRRWWLTAAAASVSLGAVGLGTWWRSSHTASQPTEQWAQLMQAHFEEDPLHLLPPDPEAASLLDGVLSRIGAKRMVNTSHNPLPRILRAQYCVLRQQGSAHLVCELDGQRGVVFVIPAKTQSATPLQAPGWAGEMHALVGGTAGVFAQDASTAQKLGQAMAASLMVRV